MIEDGPSRRQGFVIASLWIGMRTLEILLTFRHKTPWIYSVHAWSVSNAVQRNIEFHFGKYIHIFRKGLHFPICLPQKGSGILASAKYLREQATGASPSVSRDYQVSCYLIIFITWHYIVWSNLRLSLSTRLCQSPEMLTSPFARYWWIH